MSAPADTGDALAAYLQGRRDEYEHVQAWVEQLARKWESEYDALSVGRQLAAELRERAKPGYGDG